MTATDPAAKPLSIAARLRRLALTQAVAQALKAHLDTERAEVLHLLRERYDEDGTRSWDVRLPADFGGERTKVSTVSVVVPTDRTDVTDPDALLAWATVNAPTLLKTHHVPAQPAVEAVPAYDEQVLNLHAVEEFIKAMRPTPDGTVVDPLSGQIVEGLTHIPAGKPTSIRVAYPGDGKAVLAQAWRDGRLADVLDGTPLLPAAGGER